MEKRFILRGILVRRERWGLTWRGWLLLLGLALASGTFWVIVIHPFLAPTERVPARFLIIEGWSPPSTLKEVVAEFQSGNYEQAILVRPVLEASDQFESGLYYGRWMSQLLVKDGIPEGKLVTLFPNVARKDRTYHSALAVKKWLAEEHLAADTLDVASLGPHARRSRLLYEKAFGNSVRIGIIALHPPRYDPKYWWRTSEGVREVIGESIAYLYARFLFRPVED